MSNRQQRRARIALVQAEDPIAADERRRAGRHRREEAERNPPPPKPKLELMDEDIERQSILRNLEDQPVIPRRRYPLRDLALISAMLSIDLPPAREVPPGRRR